MHNKNINNSLAMNLLNTQAIGEGAVTPNLLDLMGKNKVSHYAQVVPVATHHFYIVEEISSDVSYYVDMINVLKTCDMHDYIYIYINTPGGSLNTTQQILASMKQCPATVVTVMEGEVCSAGTFIFLAGDVQVVNGNCTFMIHNYSHMLGGKGSDVKSQVQYTNDFFIKLSKTYYGGFLSEEELDSMHNGVDFWMDSDKVLIRLLRYKENENVQYINCSLTDEQISDILSSEEKTEKFLTGDGTYQETKKPTRKKARKKPSS